jgi:hypothetical protein
MAKTVAFATDGVANGAAARQPPSTPLARALTERLYFRPGAASPTR